MSKLEPCDVKRFFSTYTRDRPKYLKACLLVECLKPDSGLRHTKYYIYTHLDEALAHPWLSTYNKEGYSQQVQSYFKDALLMKSDK